MGYLPETPWSLTLKEANVREVSQDIKSATTPAATAAKQEETLRVGAALPAAAGGAAVLVTIIAPVLVMPSLTRVAVCMPLLD